MRSVLGLVFLCLVELCERSRLLVMPCHFASRTIPEIQVLSFMRYRCVKMAIGIGGAGIGIVGAGGGGIGDIGIGCHQVIAV